MSEEPNNNDNNKAELITRVYNCPKCRLTHTVKLPKDLAKDKPAFPFPYVFLHSSEEGLDDLLTVLYIDIQYHIRAVEVLEVEGSNIFSEELTKQITEKLMDKIVGLEEENLQLKDLIRKIELIKVSIKEKLVNLDPQLPKLKELGENQQLLDLQEIPKPEIKSKEPSQESEEIHNYIKVFITSTVGPGEKRQDLTINLSNKVIDIKDTIGNIFGLMPENFHISSGGITFDEQLFLNDYRLEDGDEILIIPSSIAGNITL
ncbi:MAG: hypothetical protein ACTSQD_02800 [Promethearchaeota archaeon]